MLFFFFLLRFQVLYTRAGGCKNATFLPTGCAPERRRSCQNRPGIEREREKRERCSNPEVATEPGNSQGKPEPATIQRSEGRNSSPREFILEQNPVSLSVPHDSCLFWLQGPSAASPLEAAPAKQARVASSQCKRDEGEEEEEVFPLQIRGALICPDRWNPQPLPEPSELDKL